MYRNFDVSSAIGAAWNNTLNGLDGSGNQEPHEEGGWIYYNPGLNQYQTRPQKPGIGVHINLDNPPDLGPGWYLVGTYHTHPDGPPAIQGEVRLMRRMPRGAEFRVLYVPQRWRMVRGSPTTLDRTRSAGASLGREAGDFHRRKAGDMETSNRHSWQRYMRADLPSLLALVVANGVWLGWFVRSARVQREVVATIEKAGGMVEYDWQFSNGMRNANARPWAPKWLVNLLGVEYFGKVIRIYNLGGNATDAELAADWAPARSLESCSHPTAHILQRASPARTLTRLGELILDGTDLTDDGLAYMKGMCCLESLQIPGTKITDDGLAHVKALARLKSV